MKKKTILTVLLAAAIVLSLSVAALADFTQTITLTAPAETLTVTVPTTVQLVLSNEDGSNLTGSGTSTITNESKLPIKVTAGTPSITNLTVAFEQSNSGTATIAAQESATVTYTYSGTYTDAFNLLNGGTPITVTYTVEFGESEEG